MAGDFTRFRYSPLNDTTSVLSQQGRVLLDQDWNEYAQLQDRRWRSETMDIMGRAVVPSDTPNAFEILPTATSFTIGIGRMYVDGLQPENHGLDPKDPAQRNYDPILGELIGQKPIPYEQQPYLQIPKPPLLPTDGNPHLVYLDVWERELTYLEDPGLIDQAVAVDTGTRLQTVWQVKVLADSTGLSCSNDPFTVGDLAPSAGRLTTFPAGVPASTDPCIVPANGGYRGSGNRCYRVEIHNDGPMGGAKPATFKWSRDNASVATQVTGINAGLDKLTVVLTKRDSVLRFQPGDWVEVTDDFRYFAGLPGEMRQVAVPDDVNLTIQLHTALPAGVFDTTDPTRHTRVIRWDQKGIVFDSLGNQIVDVDTNGGLIPVPAAGTTIVLEDGIQITFSIDATMPVQKFRPLDYWMFDARVIDASIEILTQAPPRGIQHHYAWLATMTFPNGQVSNCRVPWPPSTGESCDCTVCVTADSHNNGTLTLQSAVNQVTGTGGKICLSPGTYLITAPITISHASDIEISGHGLPSLVATGLTSQQPIMQIDGCADINVHDVGFFGAPAGANQQAVSGIFISSSNFIRVTRCMFTGSPSVLVPADVAFAIGMSTAVGLSDLLFGVQIDDCIFSNVQVGVGPTIADKVQTAFVTYSSIQNNAMVCTDAGVKFDDPNTVFSEVSFADNSVTSPVGFQLTVNQSLDVAIERNSFTVSASDPTLPGSFSAAIVCSASQAQINDNEISKDPVNPGQDGIVLAAPILNGTQVRNNYIKELTGNGILVKGPGVLQETIISQNQMLNLGGPGIQVENRVKVTDLYVTGNIMEQVGLTSASVMAGIFLAVQPGTNVNLDQNTIVGVGPDPSLSAARFGIAVFFATGIRIAGNRVIDIGPQSPVNPSVGILSLSLDRLDIIDNEVRRASTPLLNGDSSMWGALEGITGGAANVRGNLLESFGTFSTALVYASSCIFSENQCFLDNLASSSSVPAVLLFGGAIVAANNIVQTPILAGSGGQVVMSLNPQDIKKTLTVLGNITTGDIQVSGSVLGAPWAPLNARNV